MTTGPAALLRRRQAVPRPPWSSWRCRWAKRTLPCRGGRPYSSSRSRWRRVDRHLVVLLAKRCRKAWVAKGYSASSWGSGQRRLRPRPRVDLSFDSKNVGGVSEDSRSGAYLHPRLSPPLGGDMPARACPSRCARWAPRAGGAGCPQALERPPSRPAVTRRIGRASAPGRHRRARRSSRAPRAARGRAAAPSARSADASSAPERRSPARAA